MQGFRQLKLNFGTFVIVVTLLNLVGCASPYRVSMSNEDLTQFRIDCQKKEEQLRYLRSLLPNKQETSWAKTETKFFGDFTPGHDDKQEIASGTRVWWVKSNITDIYQTCKN